MGEGVTIDIGKHPRSTGVQLDGKGYYYIDNSDGRVNLTSAWYPDVEGTYRKITHSLQDRRRIGSITHNRKPLSGITSLGGHTSVSVYYWAQDHSCSKPLLIQLGEGDDYYKTDNGTTWTKQGSMTADILKSKLDGQNCERNQAHIVDLSQKNEKSSSTYYNCLSCNKPKIRVYNGGHYYGHTVSGSFPISGFKNAGTWQTGLSSLKTVSTIRVYWDRSAPNLIVVQFQRGSTDRYFRRNTDDVNSWIEVTNSAEDTLRTPAVDLDLSNISGKYSFGGTTIKMAVLDSNIGDGYWKHEYSLRGSLFKVGSIMHGQITLIAGISSQGTLISISAYYYGESPTVDNLLLVELSINTSDKTYKYFHRQTKDADNWSVISGQGTTRLQDNSLKTKLEELRKKYGLKQPKPQSPPPTPTIPKPPASTPKQSQSAGQSPSQTPNTGQSHSSQSTHNPGGSHKTEDVGETSTSPTSAKRNSTSSGVIAAGVIGGLLCILILTLFIKRVGPSVKTYMASRRQTLL